MQVEFLSSKDEELQANSAGALQSICFQPEGRKVVRSLGAIPPLVELLTADSINVCLVQQVALTVHHHKVS